MITFNLLRKRAESCLQEVGTTVDKIVVGEGEGRRPKIRLKQWYLKKGEVDDMAAGLVGVRKALCEMLEFLQM